MKAAVLQAAGRLSSQQIAEGSSLGGRNSEVSGEWMGRMQTYVESRIPGVNVMFAQGVAGDISPRWVGGLDGHQDDINVTYALGDEIGREVVRIYRTLVPTPTTGIHIEVFQKDIVLPRTYRELAAHYNDPAVHAPTTLVRMGELMWVTFPGEMFSAIGKWARAACPALPASHGLHEWLDRLSPNAGSLRRRRV